MQISVALKEYLTAHGIKQTFVAEKCGWSKQKINCIVSGRQRMTAEDMRIVCDSLNLPYDYFYNAATSQDSA